MHSGNLDREIALNWKHWSSPNSECVFATLTQQARCGCHVFSVDTCFDFIMTRQLSVS